MLAARNDEKSSTGAALRRVLLATMKSQQAVAIRFVGRRVIRSTCLFFSFSTALPRLHIASRCELALKRLRRFASGTTLTAALANAWI
jgi:hypothetical protein